MVTENQLQVSNTGQQNEGTNFFKTCFNGLNALTGLTFFLKLINMIIFQLLYFSPTFAH